MIRRGLQFVCGLVVLGAAHCFAEPFTGVAPNFMVLQDYSDESFNGYYVLTGSGSASGYTYTRFDGNQNGVTRYISLVETGSTSRQIRTHFTDPGSNSFASSATYLNISGTLFPPSASGTWLSLQSGYPSQTGTVVFGWGAVPSEYEQAFPDWESAAVKIPLGFTFAMAFWAAAVGLSIAMKWVRDLASAAT